VKRSQGQLKRAIPLSFDEVDMLDEAMTEYLGTLGVEHQHLGPRAESLSGRINALRQPVAIPAAWTQKRMLRTMFLPTPSVTIAASSSENSIGFEAMPRTALGSQV
jgi:hypothetical protein